MKTLTLHTVAALAFLIQTPICRAALVTALPQFPSNTPLIDFSQFDDANVFGPGPVEVGQLVGESVLWSSNNSQSTIFSSSFNIFYSLGDNGYWESPMSFAGVDFQLQVEINSMRFDFASGPVNSVGGLINYSPNTPSGTFARISALGLNGVVLETYDLMVSAPISTPNAVNQGAFRGIVRASDDIYAFEMTNSVVVIDDLRFARQAPEPSSCVLLFCGVLLCLQRRSLRTNGRNA